MTGSHLEIRHGCNGFPVRTRVTRTVQCGGLFWVFFVLKVTIAFYRLLLIQEKEQLLRELRSIKPKGRSQEEMEGVRTRIKQLEHDLVAAREYSSKQIAERIKLTDEKSRIMSQLAEATELTTYLESQLRRHDHRSY